MAYPEKAGKAALTVITNKDLITLDLSRSVADGRGAFRNPLANVEQPLFEEERVKANALPHRRLHLESLALRLQFTPLRNEVEAILDSFRSALPPVEEQTNGDKLWRLALKRMDLRTYRAQEQKPEEIRGITDGPAVDQSKSRIYFVPEPLESDLQAVIDDNAPEQSRFTEVMSLSLWALKAFEREPDSGGHWREHLEAAKAKSDDATISSDNRLWADAPIVVAAVCVRDHWSELGKEDCEWCIEQIITAIERDADKSELATQLSGSTFGGAVPAASVLPIVLEHTSDGPTRKRVFHALALAITHTVLKVRINAAHAIGHHFASTNFNLILGLVRLLVLGAARLADLLEHP